MTPKNIDFFSFSDRKIPVLLIQALSSYKKSRRKFKVVDMGCGEGAILATLEKLGYLDNKSVTAVDISQRLVSLAKSRVKSKVNFIVADVTKTTLPKENVDMVYSIMVIEHLQSPEKMIAEIYRILKPGGVVFISTIVKKWWGIYFYRNKGKFVVDPTHIREFGSSSELAKMMENGGFRIIEQDTFPRRYRVIELVIKLFIRLRTALPTNELRNIFDKRRSLAFLRDKLLFPAPGFYETDILCQKV